METMKDLAGGLPRSPMGVFGTAPETLLHKLYRGVAPQKTRIYGAAL